MKNYNPADHTSELIRFTKKIRVDLSKGASSGTFGTLAAGYPLFSVKAGTTLYDIVVENVEAATVVPANGGTLDLGDGDDPDRYLDAIAASEIDGAGETISWKNDGSPEGLALDLYTYDADDTVDLLFTDAANGANVFSAGKIDLHVTYCGPQADHSVFVDETDEAFSSFD